MNRMKKTIACAALGGMLALTVPAAEARRDAFGDAGKSGAESAGEAVLIGIGAVTGVLVLIGGSVWYYFHHRAAAKRAEAPAPPPVE